MNSIFTSHELNVYLCTTTDSSCKPSIIKHLTHYFKKRKKTTVDDIVQHSLQICLLPQSVEKWTGSRILTKSQSQYTNLSMTKHVTMTDYTALVSDERLNELKVKEYGVLLPVGRVNVSGPPCLGHSMLKLQLSSLLLLLLSLLLPGTISADSAGRVS